MPFFRKLSAAEIAALEHGSLGARALIAREYDALLEGFAAGDYGQAGLHEGERRAVVRQRLQAAAGRRGLRLRFRSGPHPALIFWVETAQPATLKPAPIRAPSVAPRNSGTPARDQAPPRPRRLRETAAERYHEMLPRWMRTGDAAGTRLGRRVNDGKRRPR